MVFLNCKTELKSFVMQQLCWFLVTFYWLLQGSEETDCTTFTSRCTNCLLEHFQFALPTTEEMSVLYLPADKLQQQNALCPACVWQYVRLPFRHVLCTHPVALVGLVISRFVRISLSSEFTDELKFIHLKIKKKVSNFVAFKAGKEAGDLSFAVFSSCDFNRYTCSCTLTQNPTSLTCCLYCGQMIIVKPSQNELRNNCSVHKYASSFVFELHQ